MRTDGNPGIPGFALRELEWRGTPLRYAVGGSGPPLVLVHGLGGAASNWRLVAPALAAGRRVIVPELPGHGGSAPLPAVPTVDVLAEAVLAVLEAEDALPAPWVGHSLGGLVGIRAAVRRPEAVRGLVLAAAAGISSTTKEAEVALGLIALAQPGRLIAPFRRPWSRSRLGRTLAFGWWAVSDPAGLDPEMAEAFLAGPAEHSDTVSAGRALLASDPRARARPGDLSRASASGAPTTTGCRPQDGMEYARRLRAPFRTIAGAGHLLIGERPEACVAAIRSFLAAL